ncbi:MAG: bifunctional 5,10-methylenetetrahydrofolate dehydrogenase/5,10-methenyltetrahydrofolate cyclohydrolase [Candidatus Spechtbacteria bacterium]|nr:bifunctional 5,10-methylenetetrahydrofolate dehydrogenase/5,10-methenyltetrahydrofolate cyclohydrolase [Candidatus Spechtbacteria bacterium]
MSAKILDGKKLSEKILSELKEEVKKINKPIKLGVILVGDNEVSQKFIERKKKVGEDLGVEVKLYKYKADITTKALREQIGVICRTPNMGGVIVQLPLPEHINTQNVLDAILPEKDVDVLGYKALGKFYANKSRVAPPTASGIVKLLLEYNISIEGKVAAMVGYGRLVGKPTAHMLEEMGATVIAINKDTKNKTELVKMADIVVIGTGEPGSVTKDMIKKGAVVIDAGITFKDGKIAGDAAEDVKEVAGFITPVPGGVGPMTVAMLLYNLAELAKNN